MERDQRNKALLGDWNGQAFNNEIERGVVVRVSEKFRGKWVIVFTKAHVVGYVAALVDDWDVAFTNGVFRHAVRGSSIAEAVQNVCLAYCERNWQKFLRWKDTKPIEQSSLFE